VPAQPRWSTNPFDGAAHHRWCWKAEVGNCTGRGYLRIQL